MAQPRIVVVTAGMSLHSSSALLADRLLQATQADLQAAGTESTAVTYHLSQFAHAIADHLTMGFPSGELVGLLRDLREAEAVIVVSPTFKSSYTGLFKSLWDLTEDGDIDGTPVLLGATGGSPRHSLMLEHSMRPLFNYLHADLVTTGVFAATDDFGAASALESRVQRAGRELAQKILWRAALPDPVGSPQTPRRDSAATEEVEEQILREQAEGGFEPGRGLAEQGAGADDATAQEREAALEVARTAETDMANRDHSVRPQESSLKLVPFEQLLHG